MKLNILIVGVGGQGTLLASRVLGSLAAIKGLDCKLSEVHGMAQRGGSVVTHVKMAQRVFSPIVAEGEADIVLAFEKLEALRYLHFLKKDGCLLVNLQEIYPMPVIVGDAKYPSDIIEQIEQKGVKMLQVDAMSLALEAGNAKTANTVMIGALAHSLGIAYEEIKTALEAVVPAKLLAVNVRALELGYRA